MALRASILVYGQDPQLLATRAWVLERASYVVWTTFELADVERFDLPGLDLLVLCHSLPFELCNQSLAIAKRRWPQARVLLLFAGPRGCHPIANDESLDATRGPVALLETVASLIRSHTGEHSTEQSHRLGRNTVGNRHSP